MSLRRFVNLVMVELKRNKYSLRRIDLSQQEFFYPTTPLAQQKLAADPKEMEPFEIPPSTCLNFQPKPCPEAVDYACNMYSFGVSESKIICTDNFGVSFLYNTDEHCVTTMPALHSPKRWPISLSVFNPEDDGAGSLYVMEKGPRLRPDEEGQFEALVYGMFVSHVQKSWRRHSLPPPPFVLEPGYKHRPASISSYAVLGGGSHLCVSVAGWGTYCFDTARREWSCVGDWMLPIYGKAEYVPELGLWFGTSRRDHEYVPCACDLSSALHGQEPELRCKWDRRFPAAWIPVTSTQMVNLGAGRFFTLDHYQTMVPNAYRWGDPVVDQCFAVLAGLELKTSQGSGAPQLIFHKSKISWADGDALIDQVL